MKMVSICSCKSTTVLKKLNIIALFLLFRRAFPRYFRIREVVNPGRLTIERRNEMKPYTLIGIILIVLGIVAFAYQGITYTTREKVVDIGPIEMTADKTKTIPLPPILGGVAVVGGIVLLVLGSKKD
jgi:hypothetical protein